MLLLPRKKLLQKFNSSWDKKRHGLFIDLWKIQTFPKHLKHTEEYQDLFLHIRCRLLQVKQKHYGLLLGQKKCTHCACFYLTKELRCNCCNVRLRQSCRQKTTVKVHDEIRQCKEI